jgi:glycosyl transferase family 2
LEAGPISAETSEEAFKHCAAIIAIPVRNEQDYIEDCLGALSSQTGEYSYGLVLVLNNCTDETPAIVNHVAAKLPIPICVTSIELPVQMANSGFSRRIAMEKAALLARAGAVLMTTDADGRVPDNWIESNLSILRHGIDAVAGRAELDPIDAAKIPKTLHEDDALECHYGQLLDEIYMLLDPDPADPWPRHNEHSGASLAVTLEAYRRAGGMPVVSPGEDRAFFEALRKIDARIRHAPEIAVTVSGRIIGRAIGGMADTIRRRLFQRDIFIDDQLEPAADAVKRATLRRAFRAAWKNPTRAALESIAGSVSLDRATIGRLMSFEYCGAAWAELERSSPVLIRRSVLVSDLGNQMTKAVSILSCLRKEAVPTTQSTHRYDNALFGVEEVA